MTDAELASWVDARLGGHGILRTGPLALFRTRRWADVHSAPTDAGAVWLKATAPETRFEVGLGSLLAEVVPDRVLAPLGADPERGLLLLPDGGTAVGDRFTDPDRGTAMRRAARQYADLQQTLAAHVPAMLRAGVPDMRPVALPDRFEEALAAAAGYADLTGSATDRQDVDRIAAARDTYRGWCRELAASPFASTVDHNDLHAWNVVGDGPAARFESRFWDWGDAVVAHPFASLLFLLDTAPTESRDELRDDYLAGFGDPAQLRPLADLAVRACLVARALVWARAFPPGGPDSAHAREPLEHLLRMLDG